MFQNEFRLQNRNSFLIADLNIVDGYKSKESKRENTLTHLFSNFSTDLDFENFVDSSINISFQKVNNDTYTNKTFVPLLFLLLFKILRKILFLKN